VSSVSVSQGMRGGSTPGMPMMVADTSRAKVDTAEAGISALMRLVNKVGQRVDAIEKRLDELRSASSKNGLETVAQLAD
jgi:hypothetical protein